MGITLCTMKEGDIIVILERGDTPLMPRPHGQELNKSIQDMNEWDFYAESYLHGLLNGEVMLVDCDYQEFALR